MKTLLTLVAALVLAATAAAAQFPDISITELKSAIETKQVVLLDVNGTASYQSGHIPGAIDYTAVKKRPGQGPAERQKRPGRGVLRRARVRRVSGRGQGGQGSGLQKRETPRRRHFRLERGQRNPRKGELTSPHLTWGAPAIRAGAPSVCTAAPATPAVFHPRRDKSGRGG
jgi:rhodanese-related sulfurtransferase